MPFIKYQTALMKNSIALLPSEIITKVQQKNGKAPNLTAIILTAFAVKQMQLVIIGKYP